VRTPANLLDLYFKSVGRGASLLVNLPPDRRGHIHGNDVASLQGFRQRLNAVFGNDLAKNAQCTASNTRADHPRFSAANLIDGNPETYWSTDDDAKHPELILEFSEPTTFSIIGLREFLPLGQRITRFAVDVERDGEWREWCSKEAVGCRRLVRGERCTTTRLRVRIVDAPVCPALSALELYIE